MEEKLVPYQAVSKIPGNRVLVFAPHPDDEVFGCAGAIMHHMASGDVLSVIIVSNGEYRVDAQYQAAYSEIRKQESREAAHILGYGVPIFWEIPDRSIEYGEALVQRILEAIDALNADLIYAPSVYEMHPDHRSLGMAALEAVRRHSNKMRLALYEVGIPMMRPTVLLDISNLIERKQQAMSCFASQLREQAYDQHIAALNRFRTYTLGKTASAAEAYFVASADQLKSDLLGIFESEYSRRNGMGIPMNAADVPMVSVLVRSMDRPLLQDALDSLALQTYSNIEVVVINARGEEHRPLGNWCGRFPLRTVSLGLPLLRPVAANVGLDSAAGDYLMFLDDDDWLAPDHIYTLVTTLRNSRTCQVAYAGIEFRGEDRQPIDSICFNEPFNVGKLRGGNYIPIHAVLFARTLLARSARFDEQFGVYEDWDFLLQLSQLTRFAHVANVSGYYRASGTSGVGAVADEEMKRRGRAQVFEKWKLLWSGSQVDELINETVLSIRDPLTEQLNQQNRKSSIQLDQLTSQLHGLQSQIHGLQSRIHELQSQLDRKDLDLGTCSREILTMRLHNAGLGATLIELQSQLEKQVEVVRSRDALIHEVINSSSWKFSAPIRWAGRFAKYAKRVLSHDQQTTDFQNQNTSEPAAIAANPAFIARNQEGNYSLSQFPTGYVYIEPQRTSDIEAKLATLTSFGSALTFCIVVPVYNTPAKLLDAVIASVEMQWYPHWKLILTDDASTDEETLQALSGIVHPKIQVQRLKTNQGISEATNAGMAVADGDFIVFMDHDDELTVDCLYELALCAHSEQPDFIYSDEDKLNELGEYTQPHFKPHWSPDTMMSTMFTGHVSCVRRSLLDKVGGLRTEVNGCQDWDFVLRVAEQTARISHIPKVLYHWRIIPASVASDIAAKPYVLAASRKVRVDALARRRLQGSVEPVSQVPGYFRVNYHLQGAPRISIIIPTRDREDTLRCCIESILEKSSYANFEIIILDNGSVDHRTITYLQELEKSKDIRVIRHDRPFNFSELNNIGAQQATGELLMFLNDDTEVLSCDWLERMGGYAQLPHVAAVGAKLIYPETGKTQHAGVLNLANGPVHAFLNGDPEMPGYFMRNLVEYDWLAVTGACLMIEAEKFRALGTFDTGFPIAYNDIELCMRAVSMGFYNVVCQAVRLVHHESVSRGSDNTDPLKTARLQGELVRLYDKHPAFFQFDPFHSPNLDPSGPNFELPM